MQSQTTTPPFSSWSYGLLEIMRSVATILGGG
jgi:hypothetical protein